MRSYYLLGTRCFSGRQQCFETQVRQRLCHCESMKCPELHISKLLVAFVSFTRKIRLKRVLYECIYE